MALLDRLLPAWRHSDPEVRAAAVRDLGKDSLQTLATIARADSDARVRRLAIKKLDDPDLLAEIGRGDAEEDLRELALARAEDLLVERAAGNGTPDECLRALAGLGKPGSRVTVATRAAHGEVRRAALASLSEERAVAEVARRGDDARVGIEALARVNDLSLLRRIAGGDGPTEVALAALARLRDPAVLQEIAADQRAHKPVRKQARAALAALVGDDHPLHVAERRERLLQLCAAVERLGDSIDPAAAAQSLREAEREWQELSARPGGDPLVQERFRRACAAAHEAMARAELLTADDRRRAAERLQTYSAREQLCERVEALQGADIPAGLEAARAAWQALGPFHDLRGRDLAARFAEAVERCEQRNERWQARHDFHSRIEALVSEAERLVELNDPHAAARPRAALEGRWAQLESSPAGAKWLADERALQRRFAEAGEALKAQEQSLLDDAKKRERDARGQLKSLCHQLEQLLQLETLSRAAAERALNASADVSELLRAVPAAERDPFRQRLISARQSVAEKAEEQARAEEWKLWANAEVQRKLIERAEGLLAGGDSREILRELGRLDQEWKRFAAAPRDQSQTLWDRFRAARDEMRQRGNAYLGENLTKKEALCAAIEPLAESTEWAATVAAIRRLQEEWKQIGPVRQQLSVALFERFRAPANRFFARQKEFLDARRQQRDEMFGRMRALCEAAEALVESTDWDAAAAEIKKLQLQGRDVWKGSRPPARKPAAPPPADQAEGGSANEPEKARLRQGDVLQLRFRAACDGFFERYRRRDEVERESKAAAMEAVLADLEALRAELASAEPPAAEQVAQRIKERLADWGHAGTIPPHRARALSGRLQEACDTIEAACPEAFGDTAFDAESNVAQREKLCTRIEKLAASLPAAESADDDLATRLKRALAAKTIGGSAASPEQQQRREAQEAAERLKEKWQRLGPVLGGRARALAARFEQAAAGFDTGRERRGEAEAPRAGEAGPRA